MAKLDGPNFITLHIEKIVLAVSALIFVLGLYAWVLAPTPPVELSSGSVATDKIDQLLLAKVQAKRDRIDNNTDQEMDDIEPLAPCIAMRIENPFAFDTKFATLKNYGEGYWKAETIEKSPELAPSIAGLLPSPTTPVFKRAFRAVLQDPRSVNRGGGIRGHGAIDDDEDKIELKEQQIVIISSDYDITVARTELQKILIETTIKPMLVFLDQEVQMQTLGDDGKWSEPVTKTTARIPFDQDARFKAFGRRLTTTGAKELTTPPAIPNYDPAIAADSAKIVFDAIKARASWQELMLQPEFRNIYYFKTREFISWKTKLKETTHMQTLNSLIVVGPEAGRDLIPREARGGIRGEQDLPQSPVATNVASFAKQWQSGKIHLWFFYDKVTQGVTYRFRSRLKIVNPLLTYDKDVENQADALAKDVMTAWSGWSEPVEIGRPEKFFIIGGNEKQQYAKLSVYTKIFDQTVTKTFRQYLGEIIGNEKPVKLINPHTGLPEEMKVDFDTSCIMVDVNKLANTKHPKLLYLNTQNQLCTKSPSGSDATEKAEKDALQKEADEVNRVVKELTGEVDPNNPDRGLDPRNPEEILIPR